MIIILTTTPNTEEAENLARKIVKGIFATLVCFLFLFLASCNSNKFVTVNDSIINAQILNQDSNSLPITPNGNELKTEVQRLKSNFNIKVTNISENNVYCYYVTGRKGDRTSLHYLPERRNTKTNKFERYTDGPDSLPPLSTLKPNQTIEFEFNPLEIGEYRLKFPYLIDENIANMLKEKVPPQLTKSEE